MKVTSEAAKITKTIIESVWKRRASGERIVVRDKETAGLALVVNATTMTWIFGFRPRGTDPATKKRWPNKTITLGNPDSLSVEDARHAAAALKGHAASGRDPHAEQKAKRSQDAVERAATVSRLLELYEKALPRRPKLRGSGLPSASHVREELAQARAAVATMEIADLAATRVDASHVRRLANSDGARPATARARFGAFSRFMDWAQEEGVVALNPCLAVARNRRPKAAPARAHYLTLPQLAAIWKAAGELEPLYRDIVRLLVAIPCRRGEATELDWCHLDMQGASWSQPGALTKNGEPHRLHLHTLAFDLLSARHEAAQKPKNGLVFPAPRSGKPIDTFTDIKGEIDKRAEISGWRWHDFRRSFASVLGEAGLPEPVVDAVLNHRQSATRSGVLGVYQRAQRWPEQVSAMKAWGAVLTAAIEGRQAQTNVVPLRSADAAVPR